MAQRISPEAFTPGEYIREELVERGWTQMDLAEILGRPPQVVNEIVAGKRSITPETARSLGATSKKPGTFHACCLNRAFVFSLSSHCPTQRSTASASGWTQTRPSLP